MTYIGSRLRYLREQDHITQQQLADSIGVAKSTISMYENGQREPDFEKLEALADFFNVDMRTFFPGETPNLSASDFSFYSSEAMKLAKDYDKLDGHGQRMVRLVADEEKARCAESAHSDIPPTIKVAARSGDVSEIEEIHPDELPDDNDPIP